MALRGRKIENFDDISLAAWSQGLLICVSSSSFQKSSISWPQQPLTEKVSDISEHATRDILSKFSILLPFRAIYFRSYQYDTPCSSKVEFVLEESSA